MYSVNLTVFRRGKKNRNEVRNKLLHVHLCVVIKLLNSVILNAWVVTVLMKDILLKTFIFPPLVFFTLWSQICIVPPLCLLFCANFVFSIVLLKAANRLSQPLCKSAVFLYPLNFIVFFLGLLHFYDSPSQ